MPGLTNSLRRLTNSEYARGQRLEELSGLGREGPSGDSADRAGLCGDELVANPAFAGDLAYIVAVGLEFLAEASHIDLKVIDFFGVFSAPDFAEQRRMRDDASRISG